MQSPEEYLNKQVRPIIEALAEAVIQDEPKDPHGFMIEWLQTFTGVKNSGSLNMERQELE